MTNKISEVIPEPVQQAVHQGVAIPASPLALDNKRMLDERHQRALWRYYSTAGAGGIAIGVHTTQFAIRRPEIGLFRPLLEMGAEEMTRLDEKRDTPLFRVAGVCGKTPQAAGEASLAQQLGYHAGLLSLAALGEAPEDELIAHCREVSGQLPLIGFYLQPAVGGRILSYSFWRRFAEIENVIAIKIAPFNRYQTLDVVRAVAAAGREDIALYTGNDDTIVTDLLTPFRVQTEQGIIERRIAGGLLGHWSVWTRPAVEILERCHEAVKTGHVPASLMTLAAGVTDCNAAFFDAANHFAGCIAGLHEILHRQGLLAGTWCLDPEEGLGPGQKEEIDRVCREWSELSDDAFVSAHLDEWLKD